MPTRKAEDAPINQGLLISNVNSLFCIKIMGTMIAESTEIGTKAKASSSHIGNVTLFALAYKQNRMPNVTTNIPEIIKTA